MKIAFDLKAQISVPDADFAPEKENLLEIQEILSKGGMMGECNN